MTTSIHADEHHERLEDEHPRRSEPASPDTLAGPVAVQVPIARSTVSALGEE